MSDIRDLTKDMMKEAFEDAMSIDSVIGSDIALMAVTLFVARWEAVLKVGKMRLPEKEGDETNETDERQRKR